MKIKKDIVVVGSVAFDDVKTIKGDKKRLLGGSERISQLHLLYILKFIWLEL